MTVEAKLLQGSAEWFEMVGNLMVEAASKAGLPADLTVSSLERYTDGIELHDGLFQGLRFEVNQGRPSFRVGVRSDEQADVMIEVKAAVARELNSLHSADPNYTAAFGKYMGSGEMHITGDMAPFMSWLPSIHDQIVDQTR